MAMLNNQMVALKIIKSLRKLYHYYFFLDYEPFILSSRVEIGYIPRM
jgi:hypothetical protein